MSKEFNSKKESPTTGRGSINRKIKKETLKTLKKLHREETKNLKLTTKIQEDKRTKRNRTRSEQNKKAIKDSEG